MLINSGPFTLRKFKEHSVATAFANKVCKRLVVIYPQFIARNCKIIRMRRG
jgi:hypothetical protein